MQLVMALLGERALRTTSTSRDVHTKERSSRLNTHSLCRFPSPHRHRHDAWRELPAERKKKTHFFHQLLKAMPGEGGGQTFGILKTMVSGKMHGAPTVRGRWANSRVTSANTNNCSGSLLLSALEVWVEFFNALQPISLPLIFPPQYDSSSSKTPVSLSFQFSQSFEITTAHKHKWNHKRHNECKFSVVIPGPDRFKSTKQNFQCLRSAPPGSRLVRRPGYNLTFA